eukprot:SAG31_NODE_9595_length_1253_cov_2.099653_1_plen_53_part_00
MLLTNNLVIDNRVDRDRFCIQRQNRAVGVKVGGSRTQRLRGAAQYWGKFVFF